MPAVKNPRRRHVIIDRLLKSPRGYTISDIYLKVNEQLSKESEKEVSERMIYNDIKAMPEIYNVSIIKENGRFRYQNGDDSIDNMILNEKDKELMELALQTFSVYGGSSLFEKFDDVITRVMAGSVLRRLKKADPKKYIQIGEMADKTGQEWIETIYNAIIEEQCLLITYKPYGKEPRTRTICPYLLKEYRNVWYLVAQAKENNNKGGTNLYKLNRIQKIEKSDATYNIDENFSGEDYFKYTLGVFHRHGEDPIEVKLKFFKDLIPLISENKIHPSMEIISKSDEEMVVSFIVYNTIELKNKILSFGSGAEVVGPEILKDEIKDIVKSVFKLYWK
jgi:predicted DNA-binding transcriptional regulator YafY